MTLEEYLARPYQFILVWDLEKYKFELTMHYKEKALAWWYAAIILTPLAAVILASWWCGSVLDWIMGRP